MDAYTENIRRPILYKHEQIYSPNKHSHQWNSKPRLFQRTWKRTSYWNVKLENLECFHAVFKIGQKSNTQPTLSTHKEYAQSYIKKANTLHKYFILQCIINDNNKPLPQCKLVLHDKLDIVSIIPETAKDVSDNLNAK